jgi:hypothetical protein
MSLLQQYLIERLLEEGLDDAFQFYKDKITRDKFDSLIALDPTFQENQDRLGTYGKWILTSYLRKSITEEDLENVTETLFDFEENKRYIKDQRGNSINNYKTLADIRSGLDTVEMTDNQREKLRRKQKHQTELGTEAELLFDTDKWEVWKPSTYMAAMKLGSGASWCTASTGDRGKEWFRKYTKDWGTRGGRGSRGECGELYDFINVKNKNVKFQLHVILDSSGNVKGISEFRDINNTTSLEFEEFIAKENLVDGLLKTKLKDLKEMKSAIEINKIVSSGIINIDSIDKWERNKIILNEVELSFEMFKRLPTVKKMVFKDKESTTVNITSSSVSEYFKFIEEIEFTSKSKVTEIKKGSFKGLPNLKKIILPPKLEAIEEKSFKGCVNLGEVFLPDSLRFIGYQAFSGCDNIVLKMNKRKGSKKIQVPEEDLPFLKQRLQVIGSDEPVNKEQPVTDGQQVVEEQFVLSESYSSSMPPWLRKWLETKDNDNESNSEYRRKYSNQPERFKRNLLRYEVGDNFGLLNLADAEFISAPVPTYSRDPNLKDSKIPVFHIRQENPINEFVYIPGINDDSELFLDSNRWNTIAVSKLSMTRLLPYVVNFAYVDKSNPNNFTRQTRNRREDEKKGRITRLSREKSKEEEDNLARRGPSGTRVYDKSGYRLNPEELIKKLNQRKLSKASEQVKMIYERISAMRSYLHKVLVKLDIDNPNYQEKQIREVYNSMFRVIEEYRTFSEDLKNSLNNKDEIEKTIRLNKLFNLDWRETMSKELMDTVENNSKYSQVKYTSVDVSFSSLISSLEDLESNFKKIKLVTLESIKDN